MAKLIVVCLIYFVAVALTSCSASRLLLAGEAGSSEHSESTTVTSATFYTTTESENVPADHDLASTEFDSEEFDDVFGPCMEDQADSEESLPCRRMLPDYGPPSSNPNVKH